MDYESDSESNDNNDENNAQITICEKTQKNKFSANLRFFCLYIIWTILNSLDTSLLKLNNEIYNSK